MTERFRLWCLRVGHVEEEIRRTPALSQNALALCRGLPLLLTVLAAHREGQRTQTSFADLVTALEAVAVRVLVETPQRFVDLVERLALHLNERELDVFLNVDFGALALVEHIALLAAVRAHVANSALNLGHQLAAAVLEHLPQLAIAAGFGCCLRALRRRHDVLTAPSTAT